MPAALNTTALVKQVLLGAVIFIIFWLAARLVRVVARRAMARRRLRGDMAELTERVLYVALIGLGVMLFIFIALGQFIIGAAGLVIAVFVASLGLQDIAKGYVSGFYVLLEKNVKVGDQIESGGYRGIVTEVQTRVTYLRGEQGELIVIPNADLFSRPLVVAPAPPAGAGDSEGEGAQDHPREGLEVVPRQL